MPNTWGLIDSALSALSLENTGTPDVTPADPTDMPNADFDWTGSGLTSFTQDAGVYDAPGEPPVSAVETDADGFAQSWASAQKNLPFSIADLGLEIQHFDGCPCGDCGMREDEGDPGAVYNPYSTGGGGGTGGGTTTTPLGTLSDYLVSGYWADRGVVVAGGELAFNLGNSGFKPNNGVLLYNLSGHSNDADGLTEARKDLVREAFKLYEATLGIDFQETTSTDVNTVDFFFSDNQSGAYANFSYYSNGELSRSNVNVNINWSGGTSSYDDYTLQTILHEIGHAIGLGHQGNYNGSATYGQHNTFENDSWHVSMMSYFSQSDNTTTNASYEFLQTPMVVDWMALDDLYGSQGFGTSNAFTGDTIYGFNTNITSEVSDIWAQFATYADQTASTIVDGAGIDTLDLSGYSNNTVINLMPSSRTDTMPQASSIGGRTGNLTIAEGTIIENAIGGAGSETFYGNSADNTFTGNGGNDTFYDSDGSDTYLGGAGVSDTVIFDGVMAAYNFLIQGSFLQVINAAVDMLESTIEWLTFDDQTISYAEATTMAGPSNSSPDAVDDSDTVAEDGYLYNIALLANDTDPDNDTLTITHINGQAVSTGQTITLASGAKVTLNNDGTVDYDPDGAFDGLSGGQTDTDAFTYQVSDGEGGTDTAQVTITVEGADPLGELVVGDNGDNLLEAGTGLDTVIGEAGNDTLIGAEGDDWIEGGLDDDLIIGGSGADTIFGDDGTDIVDYADMTSGVGVRLDGIVGWGASAGDRLFGVECLFGSDFNDTIVGDNDANLIKGQDGNDKIYAQGGDDTLIGGEGADTLYGQGGNDTADYADASSGIAIALDGTAGAGGAEGDQLYDIENLVGSAYNDVLIGNSKANRIEAGDGDDSIDGEGGADTIDGGNGVDTVSYALAGGRIGVRLDGVAGWSGAAGDILLNVENLIASAFNDTVVGSAAGNLIEGRAGNDTIYAMDGDDTIDGGEGADVIHGQGGNDTVTYASASSGVGIALGGGAGTGGAAGDVISSVENLIGSGYSDMLTGDAFANRIEGGTGYDTLDGGEGADTLDGGAGIDTVTYASASKGVGARLDGASAGWSGAAGDVISNVENLIGSGFNDILVGSNAANEIEGGDGNDTIYALGGNDTIEGGAGNDTMYGQGGSDVFAFVDGFGTDVIGDFNALDINEKIDLSGLSTIANYAALVGNGHMTQDGADVVIDDFAGNTLRLSNVSLVNMDASDFSF